LSLRSSECAPWPVSRFICPVIFLLSFAAAASHAESPRTNGQIVGSPTVASLEQILTTPTLAWRSPLFEVYRWNLFPGILIIDTIDSHHQDAMFTRLAYFVEKKGFRGKLMTNAQLAGRHGWNAHDYGPDGLAAFFNAASDRAFPLNPEEKALEGLVLNEGIIISAGSSVSPGRGGILSISRSSSAIERQYLLTHESFHGIFFSSAEYRSFCFRLWDSLLPAERQFYKAFLDGLGYDGNDRFLAVNEFQAYLMQQPLEYAASYFKRFLVRFGETATPYALDAVSMLAAVKQLDEFLRVNFGVRAGGTVTPAGAESDNK
jgi:hypothetical protein